MKLSQLVLLAYLVSVNCQGVQQVILLYRYEGSDSPSVQISNQTLNIVQTLAPQYQKEEFTIPENSFNIRLTGFNNITQFQLAAGWVFGENVKNEGSDFFYLINGNLNYVKKNEFNILYDQPKRPQFHFSAPLYWINDPNVKYILYPKGLVKDDGSSPTGGDQYYLSYQYDPFNLKDSGTIFWGNAISDDLIKWRHQPPMQYPNKTIMNASFVQGGAYSGGGIKVGDTLYQFFTQHFQDAAGYTESQFIFYGNQSYEIIKFEDRPPGASEDFRDPAASLNKNTKKFNIMLGTAINKVPSVVSYQADQITGPYTFFSTIYQGPNLPSTTIECPNKAYLQDSFDNTLKTVLFYSINDIKITSSYTLYVVGLEGDDGIFKNTTDIRKLDFGDHFYATQVFAQPTTGVVDYSFVTTITWMQNWNRPFQYYGNDHFSCAMTVPRQTFLYNNRVHQLPSPEVNKLRGAQVLNTAYNANQDFKRAIPELSDIEITFSTVKDFTIDILYGGPQTQEIQINYSALTQITTLIVKEVGGYYTNTADPVANLADVTDIRILVDRSAIEVFFNRGEVTFSERILQDTYRLDAVLQLSSKSDANVKVWMMGTFY